jgi:hypothetical protein
LTFEPAQDFAFEFERDVKPGKLKLRQRVPDHQWEVFPSPYVQVRCECSLSTCCKLIRWCCPQLSTKLLETDSLKDRLKISYDFNTAVGALRDPVIRCGVHA